MIKKFQYNTQTERETILVENANISLIEEQNITEGNFLIFIDTPLPVPINYINVPETRLISIESVIENGILEGKL